MANGLAAGEAADLRPATARRALGPTLGLLRLAAMLALTFTGLLAITFVIGRVVPIDPALAVVGDRAPPDVYAKARLALGLDLPIWRQFLIYAGSVLRGDLGTSVLTSRPVLEDIGTYFPATLELSTLAILIGVGLGIPAGVASAVWSGRWPDHLIRLVGLVGYSAPIFWLGLMGLLVFYARLDWVGGPGRQDILYEGLVPTRTGLLLVDAALARDWGAWRDAWSRIVLPASILGLFSMAYLSRMTRSFVLTELRQDYVTAARLKGVPEWLVVARHVMGNVAVPLVTVVALGYGSLLEGAVLTETVFAWPGLGRYITDSLFNADMNAVLGGTLVVGCVFIGLNLLSDVLYRALDPRARG